MHRIHFWNGFERGVGIGIEAPNTQSISIIQKDNKFDGPTHFKHFAYLMYSLFEQRISGAHLLRRSE